MSRLIRTRASVLLPLLAVALAGLAGLAIGYGTSSPRQAESQGLPLPEAIGANAVRGQVSEVSPDSLILTTAGGQVSLDLTPATVYEFMRPATRAELNLGDWLNAGAVPHNETFFAIIGLVIIPAAQTR